jgi:hypothetical protein
MKLDPIGQPAGEIDHERHRVHAGSLADPIGRDQLRIGIKSHEGPHIADTAPVILPRNLSLLLLNVGTRFHRPECARRKDRAFRGP